MRPKIIVAGILDTKGEEIRFIAEKVKEAGGFPVIMELSVGKEVGWADIGLHTLLEPIGKVPRDLFAVDRHQAGAWVTEAAVRYAEKLLSEGELDGMISYGGSMGASISSAVMQSLPIGIPKFLLTTMASGNARPYIGTKDICMMYPIAEAGLNSLTRQILTNAAYSVVGMASAPKLQETGSKPLIGCMMFGVTTPCVLRASAYMEKEGYDVIINHAIGSGGMSMEEMITDGYINGVLDITTHEIADELLGGVLSAGPNRLTAAAKKGIPQVIAPGGLDLINFGTIDTILPKYMLESEKGVRKLYEHNPTVNCVSVTPEEAYVIAGIIAEKLNQACGPAALYIPMRGWGACDLEKPDKELGWAGPAEGPSWVPDPDKPGWSLRSKRFAEGLQGKIDPANPYLEILQVDMHMNEPAFADLLAETLTEMLDGRWKKGTHNSTAVKAL